MKYQLYPANQRGKASFGWLDANFSFSFGSYYNPNMVQFGMLRVLNDDTIAAGAGFGQHPHDNMEIITIPLEGSLKHKDSMGNEGLIRFGEVQVMSAGTGVEHSEMNGSKVDQAKTLQIWVFPEMQNVTPRYDQKAFDLQKAKNSFVTVVAPHDNVKGDALWVYQQTYFNLGIFEENTTVNYKINQPSNGLYLFLIDGSIEIDGNTINKRDAFGMVEVDSVDIKITQPATILIIEVPMKFAN